MQHGDGIKTYAITVEDATAAFEETTKRGGIAYLEPTEFNDENGKVIISGIRTYGEVVNLFVERKDYNGTFLPGYRKWEMHCAGPCTPAYNRPKTSRYQDSG